MKKLYIAYIEDYVEGIFDENHNLLGYWHPNDASWPSGYFDEWMKKLGFECILSNDPQHKKALRKAAKSWG